MFKLFVFLTVFLLLKNSLAENKLQKCLQVGETSTFQLSFRSKTQVTVVTFKNDDFIEIHPKFLVTIFLNCKESTDVNIDEKFTLTGFKPGKTDVSIVESSLNSSQTLKRGIITVMVYKKSWIKELSGIIGWIYFCSWAVVFYPQIYHNFKRKSVIGLSFDYFLYNITGHLLYALFNISLTQIPAIKEQYSMKYPNSPFPVRVNDFYSSLHSVLANALIVVQICIYERGTQTVSLIAKLITAVIFAVILVLVCLAGFGVGVLWLDVVYICSYIKLAINVFKFLPQLWINYKTKSTKGWSVGTSILDWIGGIFSIFQMTCDGYNHDNWNVFKENATKFGLGLTSMCSDMIILFQHFVLYPENRKNTVRITSENTKDDYMKNDKELWKEMQLYF